MCINFVNRRLSFCRGFYYHGDICSSSIYGCRLHLFYLQTLLSYIHIKRAEMNDGREVVGKALGECPMCPL